MKALSIRQPWAWMIIHAGKDIENRRWSTLRRGPILIHAAKGCTQAEWDDAWDFAGIEPPPGLTRATIERGGVVGAVEIVDCIDDSDSRWFCGPFGFVLRNARPLPFVPCRGALGFF